MKKPHMIGSFSLMKKMNTSLILNTIREEGPISRADIARKTKLTPATVTNITSELIKYNLILEAERGLSSGGRKPVMLRINSNGYYVIGIYIGSKNVDMIMANLNADIICSNSIENDSSISGEEVLEKIKCKAKQWLQEYTDKKILGIGVGVHGLVKSQDGILVYAPNLGWENLPIKNELEQALNLPVFIDNDVRTMTLGESWFGSALEVSNFIFVYIGYGIGGSIVIDNQLYRGIAEGAGEIGHTTIEANGPKCSCGNYGCLQSLASEQAMLSSIKKHISEGRESIISEWINDDICRISPEIIVKAALHNDKLALEVIKEKSKYLGIGIANLINTFNPSLVIINGRISKLDKIVLDCIQEEVGKRSLKYMQHSTSITFSRLNEEAVLKGAVALVLSETFQNPEIAYNTCITYA